MLSILLVLGLVPSSQQSVIVYLAVNGSDAASGATPSTAVGTPHGARDRVRSLRLSRSPPLTPSSAPAEIRVLSGTYELNETLNLTAVDSNTAWIGPPRSPLAEAGDRVSGLPTFSGGAEVSWTTAAPQMFTATLTEAQHAAAVAAVGTVFPQLFVDAVRASIARAPVDADAYFTWETTRTNSSGAPLQFGYAPAEVTPSLWSDPSGSLADVTALVYDAPWSAMYRTISAVDPATSTVSMSPPPHAPLTNKSFVGVKRWAGLNVQSGPLALGSYRYHTTSRTLTYRGEHRPLSSVVPRLETVVRVCGGATGVRFEGVRVSHTATGPNPSTASYGPPLRAAAEVGPDASAVEFTGCAFTHTGANGLELFHNVSGVVVTGCVFADLGGRGFTTTLETTAVQQDAADLLITDSVFVECGKVFLDQPYCIFVDGQRNITVAHNDISKVPYSGIRVWGHFDSDSVAARTFDAGGPAVFTIHSNHVHDVGLGQLSDFGGIFVTTRPGKGGDCVAAYGRDTCNVLALLTNNVVHGVRHHDHGGAGIYTDESCGRANITSNLVFNNSGWGLHLHCGAWHAVLNNVFAGNAAVAASPLYSTSDYAIEPFCNFKFHPLSNQGSTILRNIFDQRVAPAAGVGRPVSIFNNNTLSNQGYGNTSNVLINSSLDLNVYSCTDASCNDDFPGEGAVGRSFAAWQAWGHVDVHSVIGSPGFAADADALLRRRDFRVDPARSAAVRQIGFTPLDLETVGPRAGSLTLAVCTNNGGDTGIWWQGCTVL